MSVKSLYEILQVHPDASPEVIKAAYKSLSTKYHPDRDKSADAARRFAEIQQAFEVLSDPDRRRRYDANPAQGSTATSGSAVVFRVDGTSTFLTLAEHQRRGWKEAAGCDLSNHDFSGISFKDAKLAKARLDSSRFNGSDFRGADLTDCSAKGCQFDKADFAGAKLMKTDFTGSNMRAANLAGLGANLAVSSAPVACGFTGTLAACDFTGTNLSDTDMKGADLRQSRFLRSSLLRAQMQGCNVSSVDLSSSNLVDRNLTGCIVDDATKFPEGYAVRTLSAAFTLKDCGSASILLIKHSCWMASLVVDSVG